MICSEQFLIRGFDSFQSQVDGCLAAVVSLMLEGFKEVLFSGLASLSNFFLQLRRCQTRESVDGEIIAVEHESNYSRFGL